METVLFFITFSFVLLFSVIAIFIYTPACFDLKAMMDDIHKRGRLLHTKAPKEWYLTNLHTIECWTITLPKSDKYLQYEIVAKTANRIRLCRKIFAYITPLMLVSAVALVWMME